MPLTDDNSIEYWYNDNPKCPYCDYDIDINTYELWTLYEEGDHNIDCPNCDKSITVSANAKWSFSTDEQEDE